MANINYDMKNVVIAGNENDIDLSNVGSIGVIDQGSSNIFRLAAGSQVMGGENSTIEFHDTDDYSQTEPTNSVVNANNSAIISNSNLVVANGQNSDIFAAKDLLFIQGTGTTTAYVDNHFVGFGIDGLNLTLGVYGTDSRSVFNAGSGNETLNAAASGASIDVYANRGNDSNTNFVATTGDGNDRLVAGTGNATLNGGAGNNVFEFDMALDAGGKTVIGDFAASQGNKVALFNYGLNNDDLSKILSNAHNDANNNAVLDLANHTITFQGVSVENLNQNNFVIANNVQSNVG